MLARVVTFLVVAGLLLYYALRGGSYDIVVRQEEALAIWWVIGLGFVAGALPRARPSRGTLVPVVGLVGLVAWTALTLVWTESDERTLAEVARLLGYAGVVVLIWLVVTRETWEAAAAGILAAAAGICALALASRLAPGSFPKNYVGAVFSTNRLSYPFGYWNAVAAWSAMSTAVALAWSAHARRWLVRGVALAAVPLCVTVGYLTYSRQAVVGIGLAAVVVLVLSRNRWLLLIDGLAAAGGSWLAVAEVRRHPAIVHATGGRGAAGVVLALVLAALICVAVVAATSLGRADRWRLAPIPGRVGALASVLVVIAVIGIAGRGAVAKGWHQVRSDTPVAASAADPASRLGNFSANGRYELWRSALRAFDAHPAHGIGAGTFQFWWDRNGGAAQVRNAHSLYAETLGEVGLPGFLLLVALLLPALYLGVRARKALATGPELGANAALVAAFVVFLFHAGIDWMWQITSVAVLAIGSIAVAWSTMSARSPAPRRRWRVAALAVALVCVAVELPGLVSTSRVRASQANVRSGNARAAIGAANDAINAEPWAATPYVQRGLVFESIGSLGAAHVDLVRAVQREPTNWQPRLLLARIEAEQGDPAEALATYREAKQLRPKGAFFSQPG